MKNAAKTYNALHGKVVSRAQLERLRDDADAQGYDHVVKSIDAILSAHASAQSFEIEIAKPVTEHLPESALAGLERIEDAPHEGLGKPVSPTQIYSMIADRMLQTIKEASGKNHKAVWQQKGYALPFNFASKKRYRGVNLFQLTRFGLLENPFFLTFAQIEDLGGRLAKGAEHYKVVYYTPLYRFRDKKNDVDFATYKQAEATDFERKTGVKPNIIPIIRYYKVFNGKDITGIDFDLDNFKTGYIEPDFMTEPGERILAGDLIVANFPDPAPRIIHHGNAAFYRPSNDTVTLPPIGQFNTIQDYYRVMFHELSHATGAKSRLSRKLANRFGSKDYAFEELIAESCATFISAEAGIMWHSESNYAEYIANWNQAITHIKGDVTFVMRAFSRAQQAADFVLQYDSEGNPKYISQLERILARKEKKAAQKAKREQKHSPRIAPARKKRVVARKGNKDTQYKMALAQPAPMMDMPQVEQSESVQMPPVEPIVASVPVKRCAPTVPIKGRRNSLAQRMADKQNSNVEYFQCANADLAAFFGKIEVKPKHSVVVTIAGGQGSGKTRFVFQVIEAFAKNYTVGHASIEEHPASSLYMQKAQQYWSPKSIAEVDAPEIESMDDVHAMIARNQVSVIDSWSKLQDIDRTIHLDRDLRKRYDGKLIIIIYQLTSDGKMRGGAASQFDGDAVWFVEKQDRFADNYVWQDKNRYQDTDLSTLRFNIASGKLLKVGTEGAPKDENQQPKDNPALIF